MTGAGSAAIWSRLLDWEIRYGGHEFDHFEQQMRMYTKPWEAYDMRIMFERFRDRGFAAPADGVEPLAALLKHRPRSYETFVSEAVTQWIAENK